MNRSTVDVAARWRSSSRMRTLWMVVVVLLVGCAPKRVKVANTPAGNACRRECMQLFNDCQGGQRKNRKVCAARENECLTTCPGAVIPGEEPVAAAPAAPATEPADDSTAGPPRCVASELPEWQGATAAEKKKLLEQCRAPAEQ